MTSHRDFTQVTAARCRCRGVDSSSARTGTADPPAPREAEPRRPAFRNVLSLVARRLDALPTLRPVLAKVRQSLDQGELTGREVAALIGTDAALTAKVLKVINAPFYGRRFKISTLGHALAMLGADPLRRIIEGFPSLGCGSVELRYRARLWEHGLATAFAARAVAETVGYDQPDEAYVAGLLHDLGKIVLDRYAPEEFLLSLRTSAERGCTVRDAEREILGVDHGQVGALVAESWNLPRLVRDVIQHHHATDADLVGVDAKNRELLDVVVAANEIAHALLDAAPLWSGSRRIGAEAELTEGAGRGIIELVRLDLKQVEINLAGEATPGSTVAETVTSLDLRMVEREVPAIGERLVRVSDVIDEARRLEEPEAILVWGLQALQETLGFDRVLYLAREPGSRAATARHVRDGLKLSPAEGEVALAARAAEALRAVEVPGAAMRIERGSDTDELLDFLGTTTAVAAAITIRGRVDGLILADTAFGGRSLGDDDVTLLRVFASSLSLLMENRGLTQQTSRLRRLAEKDELMGIHNRRSLMQLFEKEVERSRRFRQTLSVVMVDVDHFKSWNDVYGHQVGDTVLRDVAQLIVRCSRDIDVVGRYGGDEFLIVLPETLESGAILFAERLRATIEQFGHDRVKSHPECRLTISMGVAELQRDRDDLDDLVQRVDRALYSAKNRGRNQVQLG